MSVPLECPWTETYEAFFDAALPPLDRQRYEQHLESCPTCQYRLDRAVENEESLRRLGLQVGDPTSSPADPTLSHVLHRLHDVTSPIRAGEEPVDLFFLTPSDRPGILGTLGSYDVSELIGQGGMGVVLKAYDPSLHRQVAIKVMAPGIAGSAIARRRFTREAQAAAAVSHNHIVPVHAVAEQAGLPYLVMQFIAGESLQTRLDRIGSLPIEEIVHIGLQTAQGLAAAHAQGLIHRDIKPANLLLMGNRDAPNGTDKTDRTDLSYRAHPSHEVVVKITDFGLARMVDDVKLTRSGELAGTPEYMAPEQARGEKVDHRADLFSLGSVFYALCTGEAPFRGPSTVAVLRLVSEQQPTPIRELNPDVPAWLEALVNRLLEKDPAERIQSAVEVAALLEGYRAHLRQPLTVSAPRLPERPGNVEAVQCAEAPRRSYVRWLAVAAVLLSFLGVSRWLLFQGPGAAAPPPATGEFYQDFRGGKPINPVLLWAGKDGEEVIEPSDKGLRIQLPPTRKRKEPVGVALQTHVAGDVEITAGYELLRVDQPRTGNGVGVELFVMLDNPSQDGLAIARVKWRNGQDVYICSYNTTVNGKRVYNPFSLPATAKFGQLRIARKGREVAFLAAEEGGEFQVLKSYQIEPADMTFMRIAAYPGQSTEPVDVRILDFRVHSGNDLGLPPPVDPAAEAGAWLVAFEIIGLAIVLSVIGIGIWIWLRRRQASEKTPVADAPGSPAGAAEALPIIAFRCEGCGKTIKAKSTMAGMKAKCPQCEDLLVVPGIRQSVTTAPPGVQTSKPSSGGKKPLIAGAVLLLIGLGVLAGWLIVGRASQEQIAGRSLLNVRLGSEPVADVEEEGFSYQEHAKGQPFRWTDGKASLKIPVRKGEVPERLLVQLTAYRGPGVKSASLQILVNGRAMVNEQIKLGNWEKMFDLRQIDLGDKVVVEIVSDTYKPLGNPQNGGAGSDDARALGVLVRGITLLSRFDDGTTPGAKTTDGGDPSIRVLRGHPAGVSCAAMTSDGGTLISGSWDGTIKVWDVASGRESFSGLKLVPGISAIAVSQEGQTFAAAGSDRTVRVWQTATMKQLLVLPGPGGQVLALNYSADGKTLAAGGGDRRRPGELKIWNVSTGKELVRVPPFALRLWSLAFAPDGKRLVVGVGDGSARVVSVETGKVLASVAHPKYARNVAWSPDGRLIAVSYGDNGRVRLIAAEELGNPRIDLEVPDGKNVVGVQFSRDTRKLLTPCGDGTVVLWNLNEAPPRVIKTRKVHEAAIWFGLILPDDQTVATGGEDRTIRLWGTNRGDGDAVVRAAGTSATELAAAEAARAKWPERYFSFKGPPDKNDEFDLIGPDVDQCVKFEPEGLRITLPVGHPGKRLATGVAWNEPIKGDFEITIGFDVLAEPTQQKSEQGTGVFLGVDLDTPTGNRTTFTRGVRGDSGKQFITWASLTKDDADKAYMDVLRTFATEAKTGKLRLVRIGPIVYFYAAEGADGEFKLLRQDSFRGDRVKQIRIGGYTGGPEASLDARVIDLRIRTKAGLDLSAASNSPSSVLGWLLTAGTLALMGGLAWLAVSYIANQRAKKTRNAVAQRQARIAAETTGTPS